MKRVVKYDVLNDTWSDAPILNEERKLHSSCTVGNYIYVFFGFIFEFGLCTSIEVLNAEAHI